MHKNDKMITFLTSDIENMKLSYMSWNGKFGDTKKQDKYPNEWIWIFYIIEKRYRKGVGNDLRKHI